MAVIPELKPTANFLGRIVCRKCKAKITTENLLYYNGYIHCLDCSKKVLDSYKRELKKANSLEWIKFRHACENAYLEALEVAENIDDGGTCNMDSTFIAWPRVSEVVLNIVTAKTDFRCYKTKHFGSTGIMVSPPNVGQANKRCKAAETMTKVFKQFGYDASTFYMMD